MAYGDPLFDREVCRCNSCGFPVEGAVALVQEAEGTIDGLNRDLIGKRAQIKRLEGDNAKDLRRHPKYSEAREVLLYWAEHLAPKAREIVSTDRLKPTIKRLMNGHTVEGLKLCVDGYARFPYVVDGKRRTTGTTAQRYVSVDLIFRDPDHVEKGIAMAVAAIDPDFASTDVSKLDWRKVRRENHKTILRVLRAKYGTPLRDELARYGITTCPRCEQQLLVFDPDETPGSLLRCSGCGLDETMFFRALKEDE